MRLLSIIDTYTKPSLVFPKTIWFPANLGLVLTYNLQLGSSGGLSKNFYGVGIGPLSKILAFNLMAYCFISHLQKFQRNFVNRLCPVGWQSCEYDQNQVDEDPSIEDTCIKPEKLNEFATCQQGCAETGIR